MMLELALVAFLLAPQGEPKKNMQEFWDHLKQRGVQQVGSAETIGTGDQYPHRIRYPVELPFSVKTPYRVQPRKTAQETNRCKSHWVWEVCEHFRGCGDSQPAIFHFRWTVGELLDQLPIVGDEFTSALNSEVGRGLDVAGVERLGTTITPNSKPHPGDWRGPADWIREQARTAFTRPDIAGGRPADPLDTYKLESVPYQVLPCTTAYAEGRASLVLTLGGMIRGTLTATFGAPGSITGFLLEGEATVEKVDVGIQVTTKVVDDRTCNCMRQVPGPIRPPLPPPYPPRKKLVIGSAPHKVVSPVDKACAALAVDKGKLVEVAVRSPIAEAADLGAGVVYTVAADGGDPPVPIDSATEVTVNAREPLAIATTGGVTTFLYVEGSNGTAIEVDPVLVEEGTGKTIYCTPHVPEKLADAESFKVVRLTEDLKENGSYALENAASGALPFQLSFGPGRTRSKQKHQTTTSSCPPK